MPSVVEIDERVLADGTVEAAPDLEAVRAELARAKPQGFEAVAIVFMHAYRYPEHEREVARDRARARLRPGFGQPRMLAADQARRARRHHRRRRLSLADPRALRRARCAGARREADRRAPDVHDVVGRPHRRRTVRRQGRDPVRPGGRRRRDGADRTQRRTSASHRLRHGGHLDRRRAFRRNLRARLRDRGRGRAHARADDDASTPSRRAAARSCISTARAFASARIRRAPIPAPSAIAAAARWRSPTPT